MKLRLALTLAVAVLAVPIAAYASGGNVVKPADDLSGIQAEGCQVTKNVDHSVTVHCPESQSAALQWTFIGQFAPSVSVQSTSTLKTKATVTHVGRFGAKNEYTVTQIVRNNTVSNVAATFGP